MAEETFKQWAILELMGHRRLAGFVSEQEIGGASFLRLDVPGADTTCQVCNGSGDGAHDPVEGTLTCPNDCRLGKVRTWAATQYYSPQAVYCITPTTEEIARAVARENQPTPVHRWELKALEAPREPRIPSYEDDDAEENDHGFERCLRCGGEFWDGGTSCCCEQEEAEV